MNAHFLLVVVHAEHALFPLACAHRADAWNYLQWIPQRSLDEFLELAQMSFQRQIGWKEELMRAIAGETLTTLCGGL